jgi:hypothetical protein
VKCVIYSSRLSQRVLVKSTNLRLHLLWWEWMRRWMVPVRFGPGYSFQANNSVWLVQSSHNDEWKNVIDSDVWSKLSFSYYIWVSYGVVNRMVPEWNSESNCGDFIQKLLEASFSEECTFMVLSCLLAQDWHLTSFASIRIITDRIQNQFMQKFERILSNAEIGTLCTYMSESEFSVKRSYV